MSQALEALKNEQTTLKQVLSLLNNNVQGKNDLKILLNHYIYTNDGIIKEAEKHKLTPDEENLLKYRQLEKDFIKARNEAYGYFRKSVGDFGGRSNMTPEQIIKHNELEKIEDDIRKEIKRMEENELNKSKEVKINNKIYKVVKVYSGRGWGRADRAIIVGETSKMYKLQFIGTKFTGSDKQQTSYYKYEYPTTLNEKFATRAKDNVKELKIYENDTYETLCD